MKFEREGRYDWLKTFSYNAPLTAVVGGRTIGKTFGFRYWALHNFLKREERFVEVFRLREGMKLASRGYGDKIGLIDDFRDIDFRSDTSGLYIKDKGSKRWEQVGYFTPLTIEQSAKNATYARVSRIVMDEFILDSDNRYASYLPNEYDKFTNLVGTVTRQVAGDGTNPRAFLLANPLDIVNPYFSAFGVEKQLPLGYHWRCNKTVLIHQVEVDEEKAKAAFDDTLYGKLMKLSPNDRMMRQAIKNEFVISGMDFIDRKARVDYPILSILWRGEKLTLWVRKDNTAGYHVREGISPEVEIRGAVYYFSKRDASIDYTAAKRAEKSLAWLTDAFRVGRISFDSPKLFEVFSEVLNYLGLRI